MGEKLAHPPLVEAICEFRYSDQEVWDWTVPGRLYERIRQDFPERLKMQGLGVQVQQEANRPPIAVVQSEASRVQLRRSDGSALVQIGPHLLTINHLRPYPSWEHFVEMIGNVYDAYSDLGLSTALQRIGLRYINQLPFEEDRESIEDYLTLVPPLRRSLDQQVRAFYQRYELVQDTPPGVLIHQTGIQTNQDGQNVVVLDLDFVSDDVSHLRNTPAIKKWLDVAHDRVYQAFVDSMNAELFTELKEKDR